ncbi:MAG: bis-aminopropyl spermidine synthase family protein [Candidatus Heimdallarchaeaceae archaeon]
MERSEQYYHECQKIYNQVKLKEGYWGVLSVLALIARHPKISIKNLAQKAMLPIPICVAIRNEFVKRGWCTKDNGSSLTTLGHKVISSLGYIPTDIACKTCNGLGISVSLMDIKSPLQTLKKYCNLRGTPLTTIDQSFATAETSIFRILYMNQRFDMLKQRFAFVGDSDLTSIALAILSPITKEITVFDIDDRIEQIIQIANHDLNRKINFVKVDLREPIDDNFRNRYDCIFTDPPYTREGCSLFISRSIELLNNERGGTIYLSFGIKPPKDMLEIQQDLTKMGCVITDILPRFNKYEGAQKLGNVSNLYRIVTAPNSKPLITDKYTGPLYTGEKNPIIRKYKCSYCNSIIEVGIGRDFRTIEDLKSFGCPNCKKNKFQKIGETKQNNL